MKILRQQKELQRSDLLDCQQLEDETKAKAEELADRSNDAEEKQEELINRYVQLKPYLLWLVHNRGNQFGITGASLGTVLSKLCLWLQHWRVTEEMHGVMFDTQIDYTNKIISPKKADCLCWNVLRVICPPLSWKIPLRWVCFTYIGCSVRVALEGELHFGPKLSLFCALSQS